MEFGAGGANAHYKDTYVMELVDPLGGMKNGGGLARSESYGFVEDVKEKEKGKPDKDSSWFRF